MHEGLTYKRLLLILVLALGVVCKLAAQTTIVVPEGESRSYRVPELPGRSYLWQIYQASDLSQTVPTEVAGFEGSNTTATVKVNWYQPGTYLLSLSEWEQTTCSNRTAIVVNVRQTEVQADAGPDQEIGYCQSAQLDASASSGNELTYLFTPIDPGAELDNTNSIHPTFHISESYAGSFPATFRLKLTVTDNLGRTDADTVSVTVNQPAQALIELSEYRNPPDEIILSGESSRGSELSYFWNTTNGTINGAVDLAKVNVSDNATYQLTVTDQFGCTDRAVFDIPELIPPVARDDYATTRVDETVRIDVLANDESSFDFDLASLIVTKFPANGNVSINEDGTVNYTWNGNGVITYSSSGNQTLEDFFVYQICDITNMCSSAKVTITILPDDVQVNEGFSPNGDGFGDRFVIADLSDYPDSELSVFTRTGQKVYYSRNYQNDWDGRTLGAHLSDGKLVPTGVYYYILKLGGTDTIIKGYVVVAY